VKFTVCRPSGSERPRSSIDEAARPALNDSVDFVLIPRRLPEACGPHVLFRQPLATATIVTEKTPAAPTTIPPTSQRIELSAESIGFTLKSDEQTIRDIEQIQENAIKAAQDVKKFALR
jgi:hypothetical protein